MGEDGLRQKEYESKAVVDEFQLVRGVVLGRTQGSENKSAWLFLLSQ